MKNNRYIKHIPQNIPVLALLKLLQLIKLIHNHRILIRHLQVQKLQIVGVSIYL